MSDTLKRLKEIKRNADEGAEKFAEKFDEYVRDVAIIAYQEGYTHASFHAMDKETNTDQ